MRILERMTAITLFLSAMYFFTNVLYGTEIVENTLSVLSTGEVHVGVTIINIILYTLTAMLILRGYKTFLAAAKVSWPLIAIALLCILSTAWSLDPQITIRRSAYLLLTTLAGIYLGGQYPIEKLSGLLLMAFYLMFGFTILYGVVAPAYILDPSHESALRGLSGHKNSFGQFMSAFLLIAILYNPKKGRAWIRYASIVIAFAQLIASRSSSSIMACLLVVCLVPFLSLFRLSPKQRWPAIIVATTVLTAAAAFALSASDSLLIAIGRDSTFTGRSVVWQMVLTSISHRPWFGYGFDVFWQGLRGESLNVIAGAGWLVPNAHNGYLETLLSLGLCGLLLVLLSVVMMAKRAIRYSRSATGLQGLWPMAYLLFFVIHAFSESDLITKDSLDYLLFATLFTALAVAEQRGKAPQQEATQYSVQESKSFHEQLA